MISKYCTVFVLLLFVVPFVATADTVVASGHPDWSPIMYRSNDQIVGIGPDLTTKIFQEIGIETNSSYQGDWDNVLKLGREGKIDVIVAAYKTSEREKYFIYSDSYFNDPISLFAFKNLTYKNHESLIGHTVAVTEGDSYGQGFDEFLATSKNLGLLKINMYETPQKAFASLQNGESDGFLYSSYAGRKAIATSTKFNDIKEVTVVSYQQFYILISKKSKYAEIMPLVNSFIADYKKSGELDRIIDSTEKILAFKNQFFYWKNGKIT